MFVNRFIKTLFHDCEILRSKKPPSDKSIGPFIFPTADVKNSCIDFNGVHIPAAAFLYGCLALEEVTAISVPLHEECQFFEFGWLDNETIKRESVTVAEGYEAGVIDLPAKVCWMEHEWMEEGGPCTSGYLFMRDNTGILGLEVRRIAAGVIKQGPLSEYSPIIESFGHKEYFIWNGQILHLPERASSKGYDSRVICNSADAPVDPCNLFDPLMSMLGRLNADGIEQIHSPAPHKLNRQRAKSGLPSVVAHTKVRIKPPRAVLGHSGPRLDDEYTPKRYHFRRGHVRHFQNGERTWVRPCFVGDPSDGIVKHVYEVESD